MQDSRTAHVQLRFVSDDWQEVKAMSNKVYVDVLAEFTTDGILIPRSLRWKDGTVYAHSPTSFPRLLWPS